MQNLKDHFNTHAKARNPQRKRDRDWLIRLLILLIFELQRSRPDPDSSNWPPFTPF